MLNLKIDESKCIHCGMCIKDCSPKVLEFDENKIPQAVQEDKCMKCQHCLAVCPTGALSIFDKNPENSDEILTQEPEKLLNLIKSRRSIRHYKCENVDKEVMQKLKDMLHYVPTGCNNHRLHFSFIDDVNVMNDFRNFANEKIINALKSPEASDAVKSFDRYKNAIINGQDMIFRGAPHLIAVFTPIDAPCADTDPVIALSYFELYAQSLGIGTVWCGLAKYCLDMFPELCQRLKMPEGYKPGYVMLFGPRDIKFARTTQPQEYNIISVK